jgi:hypothetical protein
MRFVGGGYWRADRRDWQRGERRRLGIRGQRFFTNPDGKPDCRRRCDSDPRFDADFRDQPSSDYDAYRKSDPSTRFNPDSEWCACCIAQLDRLSRASMPLGKNP